ncbi:MAG: nicotinate (nicotinamide) nucleotide adenylyltransferase [Candidatus Ozemobacteraceae bacterium]
MRIGLLGGSFNPVHQGHVHIAEAAMRGLDLDEVRFLPVFEPVHKSSTELLPFAWRKRLLQAALAGRTGLRCDDLEERLGGPSFTIRTVLHLKKVEPNHHFYLIIGADSLIDLPHWKDHTRLVQEIPLAVAVRPGSPLEGPLPTPESRWIEMPPHEASSRDIRSRLLAGDVKGLPIPDLALALIVCEDLYGCWGTLFRGWIEPVRERLHRLPEGLIDHIEGVARLAARFAIELGADGREGFLAGLAHDLFRASTDQEILHCLHSSGRTPGERERRHPMLAHGAAAAAYLESLDPAPPDETIAAVAHHTFPPEHPSKIEQALIMADALEPSRGDPEWDALREALLPVDERYRRVAARKREHASAREKGRALKKRAGATGGVASGSSVREV